MRLTETLSKLSLMYFLHIAQNDEYPDLDINYGKTILAKSQYTGELDLNDLCSEIISELRKMCLIGIQKTCVRQTLWIQLLLELLYRLLLFIVHT